MIILSLANQKGGCGKTTTAVNLAYALANKGRHVLMVDLDPQAHATFSLGIQPKYTSSDFFDNIINNRPFDYNSYLTNRANNLYVLPSSIGLSAVEQSLIEHENKLDVLSNALGKYEAAFEYCIIDCPPNLGVLTLNALVASSYVIVPIGVCELSLKGVENLNNIIKILYEHKKVTPQIYYLLTQLDRRFKFSQSFYKKIQEYFGNTLLTTVIRTNIHLREAAASGLSIFEYKKDSRGSQDYRQLAQEIEKISHPPRLVKFILKGKEFKEVYLVGEFNDWAPCDTYKLKKIDDDTWAIDLPLKKGKYSYKFIADGRWINDPSNNLQEDDAFGGKNSVVMIN